MRTALSAGQSKVGWEEGRRVGRAAWQTDEHLARQQKPQQGNGKTKQTNKQHTEDAFALCRYNLDNLYLSDVVRTRALTDRCFDLWVERGAGWPMKIRNTNTYTAVECIKMLSQSPILFHSLCGKWQVLCTSEMKTNIGWIKRLIPIRLLANKSSERFMSNARGIYGPLLNYLAATLVAQLLS